LAFIFVTLKVRTGGYYEHDSRNQSYCNWAEHHETEKERRTFCKDLQDIFGFSTPQAIYKWQHGTALPTIDNLVILAIVLGVSMDDILVLDNQAALDSVLGTPA
jgi:transcriptional regulator with XRE-family HTH domain